MKRGRSTGKPTSDESAYIVAVKEGPCLCCLLETGEVYAGCDFHHMKSGNIRRGHMFGIGLCPWHHRGVPIEGYTAQMMRVRFGPSLMDGSRRFHEHYGSDDDLLALQRKVIS